MRTTVIGIEMPDDFPTAVYNRLSDQMVRAIGVGNPVAGSEAAAGWNALGYRFRSAADDSNAFVESLRSVGDAPEHEHRHFQEKYLYGFFVGGQSAVESLGYAIYAACATIAPARFLIESDEDRKKYSPETLRDKMRATWPTDQFVVDLDAVMSGRAWRDWKLIRNTLAHRSAPPRDVRIQVHDWAIGEPPDPPPTSTRQAYWLGSLLEPGTTVSRRAMLAEWVETLLVGWEGFLERHALAAADGEVQTGTSDPEE